MSKKQTGNGHNTTINNKAENVLNILRELQNIDPEFPIQYAICLIEIALNEGLSLTELSKKTRMALSTVSRITSALSKKRTRGQNYEFVDIRICQTERRKKELYLTQAGQNIITRIASRLEI